MFVCFGCFVTCLVCGGCLCGFCCFFFPFVVFNGFVVCFVWKKERVNVLCVPVFCFACFGFFGVFYYC